ncbi:MAG: hypothetical protein IKM59_06245, partial [Oscillospiraceae bacterium]|nr:hypothetical protein [Oscillospiraceae bacterium]
MAGKNSIIPNQDGPLDNPRKRKPLPSHPLGRYLFADHSICNFAISGAGPLQAVVTDELRVTQGVLPVIILHGNDTNMMGLSATLWQEKYGNGNGNNNAPFWVCGNGSFEPFLGMDPMDVADTMQLLARNAGFECTAHFNEVVQGHLHVLSHLGCDCCLSGLYYLASFKNLAEFESNINALNCSENEKQAILWELGLSDRENKKQFDIFRNVILRLAHEAKNSGWTPDNVLGTMNISTAIQNRATLLLNIDSNRSEYLMQYICQELRI